MVGRYDSRWKTEPGVKQKVVGRGGDDRLHHRDRAGESSAREVSRGSSVRVLEFPRDPLRRRFSGVGIVVRGLNVDFPQAETRCLPVLEGLRFAVRFPPEFGHRRLQVVDVLLVRGASGMAGAQFRQIVTPLLQGLFVGQAARLHLRRPGGAAVAAEIKPLGDSAPAAASPAVACAERLSTSRRVN